MFFRRSHDCRGPASSTIDSPGENITVGCLRNAYCCHCNSLPANMRLLTINHDETNGG